MTAAGPSSPSGRLRRTCPPPGTPSRVPSRPSRHGSPMIPIRATEPSIEIFTWPHAHDARGDPRCLGRRPHPVSNHGPRAPEHPPTPPRRFGRSSSSPEDPVPAASGHQSCPRRPRRHCPIGSNARLRAVETEPWCRSTRPRARGQLAICPSRQHGVWSMATRDRQPWPRSGSARQTPSSLPSPDE